MANRFAFLALTAILFYPYPAHGQEMTEKYIPVGAYPELAGKYTTVGEIIRVDGRARTFTLKGESGVQTLEVTGRTKIWLDRSLLKETNLDGIFSDLKTGLKAEVRVLGPKQTRTAHWIKLQITASQ